MLSNSVTRAIAEMRPEALDDDALRRLEEVLVSARDDVYVERRRRIVDAISKGGRPTDLARQWGIARSRVYQMQAEIERGDA